MQRDQDQSNGREEVIVEPKPASPPEPLAGDESGGNQTGGGYMLQVNSDWRDGGGYVVAYMDSD